MATNLKTLSAILVTPDTWQNMSHTLAALQAQTIRSQIELVLIGPSRPALNPPASMLAGFAGVCQVELAHMQSLGQAQAAGVREASAPLVVFTEDHCYPEPDWAQALVNQHETGKWAGVGPVVENANPATRSSWCQFIIEYGQYSAQTYPDRSRAISSRQIPGHNSCYRREALLEYEPDLDWWLECETIMHWDMVDRGLGLCVDPAVRTHHWNCSRFGPTLRFARWFSRIFAGYRRQYESPLSRAKLALTWPLIPLVRMKRTWPVMDQLLGRQQALRTTPGVFINLLVSGLGEGMGYLLGPGNRHERCLDLEFHRERFLRPGEQLDGAAQRSDHQQIPAPSQTISTQGGSLNTAS